MTEFNEIRTKRYTELLRVYGPGPLPLLEKLDEMSTALEVALSCCEAFRARAERAEAEAEKALSAASRWRDLAERTEWNDQHRRGIPEECTQCSGRSPCMCGKENDHE
jgi:hypothetical protein